MNSAGIGQGYPARRRPGHVADGRRIIATRGVCPELAGGCAMDKKAKVPKKPKSAKAKGPAKTA